MHRLVIPLFDYAKYDNRDQHLVFHNALFMLPLVFAPREGITAASVCCTESPQHHRTL